MKIRCNEEVLRKEKLKHEDKDEEGNKSEKMKA